MNWKDAYQKASTDFKLRNIFDKIKNAISDGEQVVTIGGQIPKDVENVLKNIGFKVSFVEAGSAGYTVIDWSVKKR